MELAPIALFVYNRPKHVRMTVESLQKNNLAKDSELFIFSDGPKNSSTEDDIEKVRVYLGSIKGFKKVHITERPINLGLSQSVISGVTEIVNKYGKIIVLEDDLVVSPYFLRFMNDGLSLYEDEEKIISICGYMYPIKIKNNRVVLFRIPDCWGWATWKRGWDIFQPDGNSLLDQLNAKRMVRQFNLNGSYNFLGMLKKQNQGAIDSWVIRWYAASFLNNKLSVYPPKSLVNNIGFDFSGSNCGYMAGYKTIVCEKPILIDKIPIEEDRVIAKKIGLFFRLRSINIARLIVNKVLLFLKKRCKIKSPN